MDDDSDDMWGDDSEDESSSDDEVPAIGYTAAYFLKRYLITPPGN